MPTTGKKMNAELEKRTGERQCIAAPIAFSYFNKEHFFDAQTLNLCTNGMCIKSNVYLQPGTIVYIRVKRFPPKGSRKEVGEALRSATLAEVKWCQEFVDAKNSFYGVGVRYYQSDY